MSVDIHGAIRKVEARRSDLETEIRSVRNELRRFRADSVVESVLSHLHVQRTREDEMRSFPWLVLLVAKWALQDKLCHLRIGKRFTADDLARICNRLWNLPVVHREGTPFMVALRRIMAQQMLFQIGDTWTFVRWPALIDRLPGQHPARRMFIELMEMEPSVYIDLSMALYAPIIEGKRAIEDSWFKPLLDHYGADVQRILSLFGRDIHALREALRTPGPEFVAGPAEINEFPSLRRYPLLKHGNRHICWHPAVFARGLDEAIHLRMSDRGEQYTAAFSPVFEGYVIELARSLGRSLLLNSDVEKLRGRVPSVEAIVALQGVTLLVEAKLTLFSEIANAADSSQMVFRKSKRIRDAIKQGWKVTSYLSDKASVHYQADFDQQFFMLVVVPRTSHVSDARMLNSLFGDDEMHPPDVETGQRLPMNRIFVLSIEEFEDFVSATQSDDPAELLRRMTTHNSDPATSKLYLSQHIAEAGLNRAVPDLIKAASNAAFARLEKALPH